MPSLKSITSAFCFSLLLTLCAVSAKADTTYTYTGNPSNVTNCRPIFTGCFFAIIDGSFTVASPLGDNLHDVVVHPKSYSFGAAGFTDSDQNASIHTAPTFLFSTDASGQIDGWNVVVVGGEALVGGDIFATIETFSNLFGTLDPSEKPFFAEDKLTINISADFEEALNEPGMWTVSTTGTNVPEPASGTLLIAGLVSLAALALKKSL
jgi:hypothetical protein